MNDDLNLLRDYARRHSEDAFAALVSRYVNLVYSVALRQVGNPQVAEEITQAVFIILAQKAGAIPDQTILPGWLCRTARYASANALTIMRRRQRHEQKAHMQSSLTEAASQPESADIPQKIAPLLEAAMGKLRPKDHDALVLRFFEDRNFKDIGQALGISEDAAKKRVNRALEKLHRYFGRQGVSSTTAILAGEISAQFLQTAPPALAQSIAALATAKGATAGSSTLTLVKGALKIMAWTKMKTAIAVGAGLLLATGTTSVMVRQALSPSVDESLWQMNLANLRKAPPGTLIIRPTRFSDNRAMSNADGPMIAHDVDFVGLLQFAYGSIDADGFRHSFSGQRMILPAGIPKGKFDLMFICPNTQMEKLQQAISRKFGFTLNKETRPTGVLVLKIKDSALLASHVSRRGAKVEYENGDTSVRWANVPMTTVMQFLEGVFDQPVVAEADFPGGYSFSFPWKGRSTITQDLAAAGLELVPATRPVEMLVVARPK